MSQNTLSHTHSARETRPQSTHWDIIWERGRFRLAHQTCVLSCFFKWRSQTSGSLQVPVAREQEVTPPAKARLPSRRAPLQGPLRQIEPRSLKKDGRSPVAFILAGTPTSAYFDRRASVLPSTAALQLSPSLAPLLFCVDFARHRSPRAPEPTRRLSPHPAPPEPTTPRCPPARSQPSPAPRSRPMPLRPRAMSLSAPRSTM